MGGEEGEYLEAVIHKSWTCLAPAILGVYLPAKFYAQIAQNL